MLFRSVVHKPRFLVHLGIAIHLTTYGELVQMIILPTHRSLNDLVQASERVISRDLNPPLCYAATTGGTRFRLNLHVGDVGHTLIFGPTGSGKSTLLGILIAQFFRYPDAHLFATL